MATADSLAAARNRQSGTATSSDGAGRDSSMGNFASLGRSSPAYLPGMGCLNVLNYATEPSTDHSLLDMIYHIIGARAPATYSYG
jgi:hypothetical protein